MGDQGGNLTIPAAEEVGRKVGRCLRKPQLAFPSFSIAGRNPAGRGMGKREGAKGRLFSGASHLAERKTNVRTRPIACGITAPPSQKLTLLEKPGPARVTPEARAEPHARSTALADPLTSTRSGQPVALSRRAPAVRAPPMAPSTPPWPLASTPSCPSWPLASTPTCPSSTPPLPCRSLASSVGSLRLRPCVPVSLSQSLSFFLSPPNFQNFQPDVGGPALRCRL